MAVTRSLITMTVHYELRPAQKERISLLTAWGDVVSFDLKSCFSLHITRQDKTRQEDTHLITKMEKKRLVSKKDD